MISQSTKKRSKAYYSRCEQVFRGATYRLTLVSGALVLGRLICGQKKMLKKLLATQKSLVGKLKLVAAMLGAKYIALTMTKNVAVVSFVFQVFGVHLKMRVITRNKLKESLITALLGIMTLRSNL